MKKLVEKLMLICCQDMVSQLITWKLEIKFKKNITGLSPKPANSNKKMDFHFFIELGREDLVSPDLSGDKLCHAPNGRLI